MILYFNLIFNYNPQTVSLLILALLLLLRLLFSQFLRGLHKCRLIPGNSGRRLIFIYIFDGLLGCLGEHHTGSDSSLLG